MKSGMSRSTMNQSTMNKSTIKRSIIAVLIAAVLAAGIMACGSNSENANAGTQAEAGTQASADTQAESEARQPEQENNGTNQTNNDTMKKVARDGADMQTEDKSMPTRIPMEGGTKINLYFGDTLITGVLNDSVTAQALIEKLPMTQHMSRYSHDFCGVTEDLPYHEDEVHYGWLNGDIDYAINAPYFTILFEDEDASEQYGDQVNIGVITSPLSDIAALEGSYDVRIELAE